MFIANKTSSSDISHGVATIIRICRIAWQRGLMNGWSGNASVRTAHDEMLITAAGTAKGWLTPEDCVPCGPDAPSEAAGKRPSSEYVLHKSIYCQCPACNAILHTHPCHLQALNLILDEKKHALQTDFLDVPLYEAEVWRNKLSICTDASPGSMELAEAAASQLKRDGNTIPPCAIWIPHHGLCAMGNNLYDALNLTEELEHLAGVQLEIMRLRNT